MALPLALIPAVARAAQLASKLLRVPLPVRPKTIPRVSPSPKPTPQPGPKRPVAGPLPDQEVQPGPTEAPPDGERAPADEPAPEEATQEDEKEDEDVCCDPYEFKYHWPIETKPALKPEYASTPTMRRAAMFQRWTCGAREYHCSGGGKTAWADGLQPEICYMKEAKWNEKKSSPYVLGTLQDFMSDKMYPDIYEQFDNYGNICRDPDPPCTECWGVGLLVIVNTPDTVPFFNALCYMTIPDGRWRVDIQTMPKNILEEMHDKYSDGIDEYDADIRDIFNDPHNKNIRNKLGK